MSYLRALWSVVWFAIRVVVLAALEGAIIFVGVAFVVGAVAWLAGAEAPRTVAINVAWPIAALWALVIVARNIAKAWVTVHDAITKARIAEIVRGDSS